MLTAKMDLLMKRLESPHQEANQIMDSRMTCETYGETGHMGNSCPITQKEARFVGANNSNNSGFVLSRVGIPNPTSPSVSSKV